MKRVYLAHQLSDPLPEGIEKNRRDAAYWAGWVSRTFRVAVSADWIWLTGQLEETPENREFGLACDLAHIERCDELWAVGPRFSYGMQIEANRARELALAVYDLTRLPADRWAFEKRLREQGWSP